MRLDVRVFAGAVLVLVGMLLGAKAIFDVTPETITGLQIDGGNYHNLGALHQLSDYIFQKEVRNTYPWPFELMHASGSCGCTRISLEPAVIPPGGSGVFRLSVDTSTKSGPSTHEIYLRYRLRNSDHRDEYTHTVTVAVDVVPDYKLDRDALQFSPNLPGPQTIRLARNRNDAPSVRVSGTFPTLDFLSVPDIRRMSDGGYELDVVCDSSKVPEQSPDLLSGGLMVQTEGAPQSGYTLDIQVQRK